MCHLNVGDKTLFLLHQMTVCMNAEKGDKRI